MAIIRVRPKLRSSSIARHASAIARPTKILRSANRGVSRVRPCPLRPRGDSTPNQTLPRVTPSIVVPVLTRACPRCPHYSAEEPGARIRSRAPESGLGRPNPAPKAKNPHFPLIFCAEFISHVHFARKRLQHTKMGVYEPLTT